MRRPAEAPKAAKALSTTTGNVARLRWAGKGPAYVRLGRSIRYRRSDLDDWIETNLQTPGR